MRTVRPTSVVLCGLLLSCATLAQEAKDAQGNKEQRAQQQLRADAFTAKRNGSFDKAATLFQKLLKLDASDSDLHLQAAHCLEKAQRYNDALDLLEKARKQFPDVLQFSVGLVRNLNLKASYQLQTTGKFDSHVGLTFEDCIREAEKVLGKHPNNRDVRLIKASTHYRLAQLDKSRAEAEELVRRFPDHPGAYIVLGDLTFDGYKMLRRNSRKQGADTSKEAMQKIVDARELALRHYRKAIELDPKRTAALVQLGHMHVWNANPKKALQRYKQAMLIKPNTPVHDWISQNIDAEERATLYQDAAAAFGKAGGSKKDAAILIWWAAVARYGQEKWPEAERLFVRAGLSNKDYVEAAYWAMWTAIKRSDLDRAMVYCAEYARRAPRKFADQVRNLQPKSHQDNTLEQIRFLAAKAYKAGLLPASRDINHVLARILDNAESWNNYGFLSRETGRFKQSLAGYENALQASAKSAQIMNDLAVILHYHLGTARQVREAERIYRKDLRDNGRYIPEPEVELDDDDALAKIARSNLKRAQKLYHKSIATAKVAIRSGKLAGEEHKRTAQAIKDATGNLVAIKPLLKRRK